MTSLVYLFCRCLNWVEKTGNRELLSISPTYLNQHFYVCEEHFSDDHYVCPTKRQRIKRDAVPLLCCPQPLSSNELSTYVRTYIPKYMVCINYCYFFLALCVTVCIGIYFLLTCVCLMGNWDWGIGKFNVNCL